MRGGESGEKLEELVLVDGVCGRMRKVWACLEIRYREFSGLMVPSGECCVACFKFMLTVTLYQDRHFYGSKVADIRSQKLCFRIEFDALVRIEVQSQVWLIHVREW